MYLLKNFSIKNFLVKTLKQSLCFPHEISSSGETALLLKTQFLTKLFRNALKMKAYNFLKKYTKFAVEKFKMTSKLKRRFVKSKVRLEVKVFLKKLKYFTRTLQAFIYYVQSIFSKIWREVKKEGKFVETNYSFSQNIFSSEERTLFKKEFFLQIDHNTRNYELLKWLSRFYLKIAVQF